MNRSLDQIMAQLLKADRLWLFLDYDGTLADFAPTPDQVVIDPAVITTLDRLAQCPRFQIAVISGRRLSQVQQLVPVANILLAGTYGVELQTPDGAIVRRVEQSLIRPALDRLKPGWQQLIADRPGFFIEDKGLALALHARFARDDDADEVLSAAATLTIDLATSSEFRVRQGQRFLEVSPALARKELAVEFILDRLAWPGAVPVYLGDDDHDEAAFDVIKAHHGVALLIAATVRSTQADGQLASPQQALNWLNALADHYRVKS